jgi:hypothetical protein
MRKHFLILMLLTLLPLAGWADNLEFGTVEVGDYTYGGTDVPVPVVKDIEGSILTNTVHYTYDNTYVYKNATCLEADKVEVAPNATQLVEHAYAPRQQEMERRLVRTKYNLPTDGTIFIYGGNLGKPQGIDYLIRCLHANKDRRNCFFLIVGSGTDYRKIEDWIKKQAAENLHVKLIRFLPKEEYEMLVRACDVGLIFLDHRFTIRNYPSRLLSYLENKMPIICATDVNTDIGRIAEENGYGYWCESVEPKDFVALVDKMLVSDRKSMGEKGYQFLKDHYLVEHTYNAIMKHV